MVLKLKTLPKVDHKFLKSFKMWCWRRMETISCSDRVRNEELLHSQGKEFPSTIKKSLTG